MNAQYFVGRYRPALGVLAVMLGTGAAASASAQDWGRGAQREDSKTCERFGADHGKDYTKCMLAQQRRRDDAPLRAAE